MSDPNQRSSVRLQIVILAGLFVPSRLLALMFVAGRWSDVPIYGQYASRLCVGDVPFREFVPEYPPLALLFTSLPAFFATSMGDYFTVFHVICYAIDAGIWLYLCVRVSDGRLTPSGLLLYALATTALLPILYDRMDIALAAILLWTTASLQNGRLGRCQAGIGVGVAFKLIPLVLLPFLLALQWQRRRRGVLYALALMVAPTLISFGAVALGGGHRIDKLFVYHLERGTEIESVPGAIQLAFMICGMEGTISFEHGCYNVNTSQERAFRVLFSSFLIAVVIWSAYIAARNTIRPDTAVLWMAAIVGASVSLSKVLSPQYLIFLLPIAVIASEATSQSTRLVNLALIGAISGLTGIVYPWHFEELVQVKPHVVLMLCARNVLLTVLVVMLFHQAWKSLARDKQPHDIVIY